MRDVRNIGRCARCGLSVTKDVYGDGREFKWCTKYDNFCSCVARNCQAPPDGYNSRVKRKLERLMKPPKIQWIGNGSTDDYIFEYGEYFLHIEQMDKDYWWFAVYYKDHEVYGSNMLDYQPKTMQEAKALVGEYFLKHWSKNETE